MKKRRLFFLSIILTAASFVFLRVAYRQLNTGIEIKPQDVCLEVWHIDTFEGGTGSRKNFLQSIAAEFSKNTQIKIIVKTQTPLSCEQSFKSGIFPDVISYGNGLELPFDRLIELKSNDVRELVYKKCYAKVWCAGGYLLFEREGVTSENVILSMQKNTVSTLAYALSGVDLPILEQVESDKAVYSFYANKKSALIATQRDIYRLQNKDLNLKITPLCGYSDLYQYASVLASESDRIKYSVLFIDWLTGESVQKKLHKIGMLSIKYVGEDLLSSPLAPFDKYAVEYKTNCCITALELQNLKKVAENFNENAESIKNALKRLK